MATRWTMGMALVWAVSACGGGADDDDDATDTDAAGAADSAPIDAPPPDASPPCGEYGPASMGTNAGFITPTAVTQAYEEVGGIWELRGNANWSCLCTPADDAPTSVAVTVSGQTRDFQTGDLIDNVDIAVLRDADGPDGVPLATATSDGAGDYSLVVPSGSRRLLFRNTDPEGDRFLDSMLFHYLLEPDVAAQTLDLDTLSHLTANALPAFIGVSRTPGTALVTGEVVDCDGYRVANAIATVSESARTTDHVAGGTTYYFSAGSTSLPVRHSQQTSTNSDGLFVVIELPPTDRTYVQVWGYVAGQTPGVDDLTLLSEIAVPLLADSWGGPRMEPLRD